MGILRGIALGWKIVLGLFLAFTIFYWFLFNVPALPEDDIISIPVTKYSYIKLDEAGETVTISSSEYAVDEKYYSFNLKFYPSKTAIVVMDPWVNTGSPALTERFSRITYKKIIPLVRLSASKGFHVVVLTNDCQKMEQYYNRDYGCEIPDELRSMESEGKLDVIYNQGLTPEKFAKQLKVKGIDSLVYVGFASNLCILARPSGIACQFAQGFRAFFIPDASAAIERFDTWDTNDVHKMTTLIYAQQFSGNINYNDFINALSVH